MAYSWPSQWVPIADNLRLPVALLGILFLACGIYAWSRTRNVWTGTFLIYAVGSVIHWGGSIGVCSGSLETALFFVYLAFTALADGALLFLALIYPTRMLRGHAMNNVLYAPALVAFLFAPVSAFLPQDSVEVVAGVILLVANLLSLIGGAVFIIRLFVHDAAVRRASRLAVVVGIGVTSSLVALLGSSGVFPGQPDGWNLILGLFPVTVAFALVFNNLGSSQLQPA